MRPVASPDHLVVHRAKRIVLRWFVHCFFWFITGFIFLFSSLLYWFAHTKGNLIILTLWPLQLNQLYDESRWKAFVFKVWFASGFFLVFGTSINQWILRTMEKRLDETEIVLFGATPVEILTTQYPTWYIYPRWFVVFVVNTWRLPVLREFAVLCF